MINWQALNDTNKPNPDKLILVWVETEKGGLAETAMSAQDRTINLISCAQKILKYGKITHWAYINEPK